MALITSDEMMHKGQTPFDVWDANGMVINRRIVTFDPDSGLVESQMLNTDGTYYRIVDGVIAQRREYYAAPLIWRKIDSHIVPRRLQECWDLQGR